MRAGESAAIPATAVIAPSTPTTRSPIAGPSSTSSRRSISGAGRNGGRGSRADASIGGSSRTTVRGSVRMTRSGPWCCMSSWIAQARRHGGARSCRPSRARRRPTGRAPTPLADSWAERRRRPRSSRRQDAGIRRRCSPSAAGCMPASAGHRTPWPADWSRGSCVGSITSTRRSCGEAGPSRSSGRTVPASPRSPNGSVGADRCAATRSTSVCTGAPGRASRDTGSPAWVRCVASARCGEAGRSAGGRRDADAS